MSFLSFASENIGEIVVPALKRCHLINYIQNPNIMDEASYKGESPQPKAVSPEKSGESESEDDCLLQCEQRLEMFD
jgi:hypothetical protein